MTNAMNLNKMIQHIRQFKTAQMRHSKRIIQSIINSSEKADQALDVHRLGEALKVPWTI